MNVADEVRKEVDELIDRLSRDEVISLLNFLRARFERERQELRNVLES